MLKLADGKNTFMALKELQADAMPTDLETYSSMLVDALTAAVDVSMIEFDDWDDDVTLAWAACIHEESNVKWKPSSMKNLVAVAIRWRTRVPGGSWQKTQVALDELYGDRRMFVYRMVCAAKSLDALVLERLDSTKIPNSYIHENKYLMVIGNAAHQRLSVEASLAVIDWLSNDMEDKKAVSKETLTT